MPLPLKPGFHFNYDHILIKFTDSMVADLFQTIVTENYNEKTASFSAPVNHEKTMFAQKLLADSDLSMTEITIEAGFSSHSYFSNSFKRNTGMMPMCC
ncbi:MAG: helix-turn-helix domain-containing protein [Lachnospiraceae bacterium]|nr:helix-turn-helix domain-containing protein [Lachnospiraceae bacterium]